MSRLFSALVRRRRVALTHGRRRSHLPRFECLEGRQLLAVDLAITEFMAANGGTLVDGGAGTPDWIEIHNAGTDAVDLAGWTLTDNPSDLGKWGFPAQTVAPGEYLVVFASGEDRVAETGALHTNFKLSADGEYVGLVSPAGVVVSEFGPDGRDYPVQQPDISYGATAAGSRYFMEPTPGGPNGPGQTGFVSAVDVRAERGFFEAPFAVEISTATPEATIRYTTDGSLPSWDNGADYAGPITISGTTTLRAVALKSELIPAQVETHTYLFPADVLHQDGSGLVSAPWGHAVRDAVREDWAVDPKIVYHADPESRLVVDDLLTIPTVSLVMDFADMFGTVNPDGTFVNGIYNMGEGDERATSVELLHPDGSAGFQIDSSVQIVGGTSPDRWKSDKLSLRLKFNAEFGSGDLEYPFFGDKAADAFDTLVLDAHLNNVWHYGGGSDGSDQRNRAQYLRDQYTADLQLAVGSYAPHDDHVHLYINGLYWGMYRLHERPDDNFAASYFGGDNDDYDVIRHSNREVVHGTLDGYAELLAATEEDLTDPGNYQAVLDLLDVDDFIDYMLVNFYVGNTDWDGHNWYATYNRVDPNGRWRFHSWDAEKVMHGVTDNVVGTDTSGGPSGIHQNLLASPEYRLRFADHIQRHFFNDGVLTPTAAAALYQVRLGQIDRAVVAESARWGDNRRITPFTRGVEWIRERDRLLNEYFPQRTQVVLTQFKNAGIYPNIDVPALNQHGGAVFPSFAIDLTAAAGTVYFTTDGTDPRLAGGGIAAGAAEFTGPFRLTESSTVKARTLCDGRWSALNEAAFVVMSELPLRVTEINCEPHDANLVPGLHEADVDNDWFEFLELQNVGAETMNLGGVQLTETVVDGDRQGITFAFAGQTLAPGERVVVVRDREVFQSRYGTGVRIAAGSGAAADGQYGGKLSNEGECITLLDAEGMIIQQFAYDPSASWLDRSHGRGGSLEVMDAMADLGDTANWRASNEFGGSPGLAGSGPTTDVLINEVLTRSPGAEPDLVELHNAAPHAVDVSHWYLSGDEDNLLQAGIPSGTTILPGGYSVVDLAPLGIDLSGTGDGLSLIAADANGRPVRFVDYVEFTASDLGVALGRWPDADPKVALLPMASQSFGTVNSGPRVGAVIISEVHYHQPSLTAIVAEDFADGTTDVFTPIAGTWEVRDGGYEVMPGAEGDTVATVALDGPLPTSFAFSATLNVRAIGDFNQNGGLIFDYHSPTDFKFVTMHVKPGKWRLGQRDESGWQILEEFEVRNGIPADTDIGVSIEVRGATVVFQTDGVFLSHDFGTPLNGGTVGVGSKSGTPRVDDVTLEWIGGPDYLEFVELTNTTDTPIDLAGWRLEGSVELAFASGTSVDVDEALLVVGFDPGNALEVAFFRQAFAVDDAVVLLGPWRGALGNDGGVVRLVKPAFPAGEAAGLVWVDQVSYDDQLPWPLAADGQGRALSRAADTAFGDSASSWSAMAPTPGKVLHLETGDFDADGDVDVDDVPGFVLAVANPATYKAAYGVPATMRADTDGDGNIDFDDIAGFVSLLVLRRPRR